MIYIQKFFLPLGKLRTPFKSEYVGDTTFDDIKKALDDHRIDFFTFLNRWLSSLRPEQDIGRVSCQITSLAYALIVRDFHLSMHYIRNMPSGEHIKEILQLCCGSSDGNDNPYLKIFYQECLRIKVLVMSCVNSSVWCDISKDNVRLLINKVGDMLDAAEENKYCFLLCYCGLTLPNDGLSIVASDWVEMYRRFDQETESDTSTLKVSEQEFGQFLKHLGDGESHFVLPGSTPKSLASFEP